MARKSLLTASELRSGAKKNPIVAAVTDGATLTITIPVEMAAELLQAVERFSQQRGRAAARNVSRENKAGAASFTDKRSALNALAAALTKPTRATDTSA